MDKRIIKYYEGTLDSEARRQLLDEASGNPSLKQEMMDCQHVQTLLDMCPEDGDEAEGLCSWQAFRHRRRVERLRRVGVQTLRYAAVLLVGVVSTWWIMSRMEPSTSVRQPSASAPAYTARAVVEKRLVVPAGRSTRLVLPDGSHVWVNAGSVLTYPSAFGAERRVYVSGEAFFEVAKDRKPFIVSAGGMSVRALGTKFNVRSYPLDRPVATLQQGKVRVYSDAGRDSGVVLVPGQQTSCVDGRWVVAAAAEDAFLWRKGLYAFRGQPLGQILKRLEVCYGVRFVVRNQRLLDYEYTGKFRRSDGIMEVMRIMQKVYPFKAVRSKGGDEITIY